MATTATMDAGTEQTKPKSTKQLKYEAKMAKQQVNGTVTAPAVKPKEKKKKENEEEAVVAAEYVEKTPLGERKRLQSLDDEALKAYHPKAVESAWYEWWEKEGFFKPETRHSNAKTFVIPIPPPNVTGNVHIGHALGTSLQDTLIRWHRMRGFRALFVPGSDHAGIATQAVIEKQLWRRERKTRHDLGRPEFLKRAHLWKDEYHKRLSKAYRRLGGSMDWSREAFTLDEVRSRAVTEAFCRLHEEGLIYRAKRLSLFCTALNTALSTLEVDNKELEGRTMLDVPGYDRKVEFGILTYFKYPIDGSDEMIEIATTRPETMLGDTGIAVHPQDKRYLHLIGKKARHPFISDRLLPIIADDYVKMDFGTGAVKLTPAHDENDYKLGEKHKLDFINILNNDGTLNQHAGGFAGQKRFDARRNVIEELKKRGLYTKQEDNKMTVPLCSRSGDIIEPRIMPQWYMTMRELADAATEAVKSGKVRIRPESEERKYYAWMENINDWCLSRQLWWGHQIPAYLVKFNDPALEDSEDHWVIGRTEDEALEKANKQFQGRPFTLERDADVLDTWFSSGLWPFSTLGWPENTPDLENFFPTTVLETGWDIIFFWVARMIMLSLRLTGNVPFSEVYCHSLIRDSEGRKMSKSLGNVIEPTSILDGISLQELHDQLRAGNLDPKETKRAEEWQKKAFPQGIPECGADALRFALNNYTTGGGDIAFDVKVMHMYRRFANKIYQATKFALGKMGDDFTPRTAHGLSGKESLSERWILHKLTMAAKDVDKALSDREFSHATQTIHRYLYDYLFDVYLENSKIIFQDGTPDEQKCAADTLYTALEGGLLLLHPFMPFLTEELWQRLPRRPADTTPSIMVAPYPTYDASLDDTTSEAAYDLVLGCSEGLRSLTSQYGFTAKDGAQAYIHALHDRSHETISTQQAALKALSGKARPTLTVLAPEASKPPGCAVYPVSAEAVVYVQIMGRVDLDKEIDKAQEKLTSARLAAEKQRQILVGIKEKAGGSAVEEQEGKLKNQEAEMKALEEQIVMFRGLKLES